MAYDAALGYDPANIMKSINDAVAKGDDAEVERLSVARYKKLQENPALLAKYGTDAASQVATSVLRRTPDTQGVTTPTVGAAPAETGTYKSFDDVLKWIDTLNATRIAGDVNQLGQARDRSLASLQTEQAAITPMYYGQGNEIAAAGATGAQGMNEFLATNGLSNSGAAGALQGRLAAQTQGNVANNKISESQAIADILRRTTGVNQDYQYGVANATNQAEADKIQQYIDAANSQRNYDLQAANYTGMLDGNPTVQQTARDEERVAAERQTQIDLIPQFGENFQREIDRIAATPETTDDWIIPYIKIARSAKVAAQASQASEQAADTYDKAMQTFEQVGIASGWVAESLGVPEGTKSMDYMTTLKTINKPYYNPNTGGGGGSSGGGSSGGASVTQLISLWKTSGKAPAGLEGYGISAGTALPTDVTAVDTIKLTAADKEIKGIIAVGASPDSTVSTTTERAYARLEELVDSGALLEEDADVILENNPALKTYVTAKIRASNSRTASQSR